MASGQWSVVLRHVERLFHGAGWPGLTEGQLLDRFVTGRDEVAFGALVARHGPMVLGVCRGVLDDPARRRGRLPGRPSSSWSARPAACATATGSPSGSTGSPARSPSGPGPTRRGGGPASGPGPTAEAEAVATFDAELRELQSMVREEVDRLRADDRMAVVLCYLEGLTHEEAADRLGWPVGTVKGRLARARERLRGRLARRGVALPGGGRHLDPGPRRLGRRARPSCSRSPPWPRPGSRPGRP